MNPLVLLWAGLLLLAGWGMQGSAFAVETGDPAVSAPLRLAAPRVPQALPLLLAGESAAFREAGARAQFAFWRSPEQLRALVANRAVDAVAAALPTAAALARRGVPCVALAAYTAPLWLVGPSSLARPDEPPSAAFRRLLQREILLPFGPGNMPELALRILTAQVGLESTHRYCGGAMEALNLLRRGQGGAALLPEPAAALAVAESGFARLLDLREVWAVVFPENRDMPTACFIAVGPVARSPFLRTLLRRSFVEGMRHMADAPEEAIAAARRLCPEWSAMLERVPGTDAALWGSFFPLTGARGQKAALFMLQRLEALAPSTVGGALPSAEFWDMGHEE